MRHTRPVSLHYPSRSARRKTIRRVFAIPALYPFASRPSRYVSSSLTCHSPSLHFNYRHCNSDTQTPGLVTSSIFLLTTPMCTTPNLSFRTALSFYWPPVPLGLFTRSARVCSYGSMSGGSKIPNIFFGAWQVSPRIPLPYRITHVRKGLKLNVAFPQFALGSRFPN